MLTGLADGKACQGVAVADVMQEEVLPEEITSYSFTSAVWSGVVPHRVELFTWSWTIPGTLKQHFEGWMHAARRKVERKGGWLASLLSFGQFG
ncbi:hypothetical protein AHAS_Ahas11G0212100 [Arachis hypogaea]